MKDQRHFEKTTASQEALQIREFIADSDRTVHILNIRIAAEEEQAQVFERSKPEYPMLAGALTARRDKLAAIIAALEQRLEGSIALS
jgi:hypothetical protein